MCGFIGGILRQPITDLTLRAFERGALTLAHRGPDDAALTTIPEARAVLAFRRLSIIDQATGRQPMSTDEGHHLVFNGEIYDYRERRAELEVEGERFRTSSDTEVLLRLLARQGAPGLTRVRGMFALAFLDLARGTLLLARDRLGIKQLYHVERPEGFFFASEPKALLALPWVNATLAEEHLVDYFDLRCVASPGTLFHGIERLPPGGVLTRSWRGSGSTMSRFWSLPRPHRPDPPSVSLTSAVDQVEAALLEAVRRRLVADVPVGAFLSGGLDSGLIVAAMRRLGHPDLQAFTAGFPGSADDESGLAAQLSTRFQVRHHVVPLRAEEFLAALPDWVELNDDLVADASALPLLAVSRAARRAGCIVLLSGEGADELFAGYGSHHKFVLLRWASGLIPWQEARAAGVPLLQKFGVASDQDLPRLRSYFVRRSGYLGTAALGDATELGQVLDPELLAGRLFPCADGTTLADLCRFDLGTRISDDLLVRTDRATMGASIEARVPFLDHELVETVLALPGRHRALPGLSKLALRLVGRRWGIPLRTLTHRKIGFQLPLGEWFRGPLRSRWNTILAERAIPGLRYAGIRTLLDAHDRGRGDHAEMLWRVFALECWHRRWIRGEAIPGMRGQDADSANPGVAA